MFLLEKAVPREGLESGSFLPFFFFHTGINLKPLTIFTVFLGSVKLY